MNKMSPLEVRSCLFLGLIFFLRMFGLFLILPVFSLFALDFENATPTLVGIALGIYGLTQALFQIPFGMLSDRFGRKIMIAIGLVVFFIGSLIAAVATDIYWLIIGRALQGTGAVASVIMAFVADQVSLNHRTKAMAMIGMSVGMAFLLSFIVAPALSQLIGLSGLFFVTAAMAIFSLIILIFWVPNSQQSFHKETQLDLSQLYSVLKNKHLLNLDLGIFILHLILTANFIVLPLILFQELGLESSDHWHMYLPSMILSVIIMIPLILLSDRKQKSSIIYPLMIAVLFCSQMGFMAFYNHYWSVFLFLSIFFTAFNFFEASLPSMISKIVNPESKGTALGVYSTSQFIGSFIGGFLGGYTYSKFGQSGVFMLSQCFIIVWFIITLLSFKPIVSAK